MNSSRECWGFGFHWEVGVEVGLSSRERDWAKLYVQCTAYEIAVFNRALFEIVCK